MHLQPKKKVKKKQKKKTIWENQLTSPYYPAHTSFYVNVIRNFNLKTIFFGFFFKVHYIKTNQTLIINSVWLIESFFNFRQQSVIDLVVSKLWRSNRLFVVFQLKCNTNMDHLIAVGRAESAKTIQSWSVFEHYGVIIYVYRYIINDMDNPNVHLFNNSNYTLAF